MAFRAPVSPLPRGVPQRLLSSLLRPFSPLPLAVALLLLLLPCCRQAAATTLYDVPWGQCKLPPTVLQERVGAGTESVFSLCLKTTSSLPPVTFDNADKLYIGNASSFLDLSSTCYTIQDVIQVQELNGTYFYAGGVPLPTGLDLQAWDLSLWPKYDPVKNPGQKVNITVANNGPTDLAFTGIDFGSLGLGKDFAVKRGNTTVFAVDYGKVNLTYKSLPLLQDYIFSNPTGLIRPNIPAAFIMLQNIRNSLSLFITYALVLYQPGDPLNEWRFFLYESTFTPSSSSVTGSGRRLLVVAAKNTAPPACCSKACCKPANPLPKGCVPKGKTYPGCLKKCGCAC